MPLKGPPLEKPIDLFQVLQCGLERKADDLALVSDETRWTWRQLDETSDNLAIKLLGMGLTAGDRVASLMPNRAALVIHYLACIKAGFVAIPLNYRYMSPEIDHALGLSKASILLAHAERAADIAASRLGGQLPLGLIAYGGPMGESTRFEDLIQTPEHRIELTPPDLKAPAYIFFTSGSTGKPKGVTHSAETFGWMLATTIASLDLTSDDILLPGSSISHVGSLLATLSGLAVGARVDVARTFDGDELLPLLRNTRPTVLMMLPAALIALVRDHNAQPDDFRSIRLCISGGDKVSAELEREFTDVAGFPIDEIYGMTEFGISNANPPSGLNKLGSVGPTCAGYQLSIRDDERQELPIGKEGRLWVKGPSEMIGYWDNPEATKDTLEDGWLDTGDIMRADEDGYLWFCGRKKQIIVHDGSNICPQEVEEALLEHPAVDNAGVVGVHNLIHGENVRAYITLRPGMTRPSSQELIRFARARIGYKAPEEIEVLDDMPLNPTGKVDRVTLKRLAAERHGTVR
ncbi:MAG: class I adenylate-forming enzyme family protein [Pseudomonadota bacterium]